MNCRDCLHYGICRLDVCFSYADNGEIYQYQDSQKVDEDCEAFSDKSEWIHLPCKVGDTLYKICPQGSAVKMGAMWNGEIVTHPCQRCPWQNCQCFDIGYQKDMENIIQPIKIKSRRFIFDIEPYIGKIWFTDKESAEKAFAERREK